MQEKEREIKLNTGKKTTPNAGIRPKQVHYKGEKCNPLDNTNVIKQ